MTIDVRSLIVMLKTAGLTLAQLVVKVDPNLNVVLTACLTVYVGCCRSVKPTPPSPSETMSNEHATRFPLVGSAMLPSLFLLFKFLSKDSVNVVLTCYFFVLGIVALLCATFLPTIKRFLPTPWSDNLIVWRFPYFRSLALRFDVSRGKEGQYFKSAFVGYTAGLVLTIVVMNWFQAAQPALLHIVPCVIRFLAAHCLWNGEVKPLLAFNESKTTASSEETDADSNKKAD
ncbi:hypothetical protein CDL12_13471 [Handroanthus impetiginosus]|uniref:Uncharacterized protein n=1 Tax=Handroanthus impetiginosus TaxID=429701 RepID=A0A2G9H9C6_9LAMI|nr:hypothetical protein CDL12_13471 [Handroanthus impetiginosus]